MLSTTNMVSAYSASATLMVLLACSSSEVQAFSTRYQVSHSWTTKTGLPSGRSDMSASTVADAIVLVGGCTGNQTFQGWGYGCEEVTAQTVVYSPLDDTYAANVPDAPRTRYRHAAAAVGTKVYVIGGTNNQLDADYNEVTIGEVDVFNTETMEWSTFPFNLPVPTTDGAAFVVNNTIFYTGGYATPDYTASNATWMLDLDASAWTKVADAPTHRGDHGAVTMDGVGYVFGGFSHWDGFAKPVSDLETYNAATGEWTVETNMPTIRGDKAAAVLHGRMHVIGGQTKTPENVDVPLKDVEVYDPVTATWENEGDIPSNRFRFTAASHDDNIYIFGGQGFLIGGWEANYSYYPVVPTVEVFSEKLTPIDPADGEAAAELAACIAAAADVAAKVACAANGDSSGAALFTASAVAAVAAAVATFLV